jgi:hypothetical protein
LKAFGFTDTHIGQIILSGKTTQKILQESINYFAFELSDPKRREQINSPVSYFTKVMRTGGAWAQPNGYKSATEIFMEKFLDQKKKEKERINKMIDDIVDNFSIKEREEYEQEIEKYLSQNRFEHEDSPGTKIHMREWVEKRIVVDNK